MSTGWGSRSTSSPFADSAGHWLGFDHSKNGGLLYGIDFRGGTLVYVRFASTPPIDQIRQGLSAQGCPTAAFSRSATRPIATSKNDVVIGLEQKGQGDAALDAGKQAILDVLHKTSAATPAGKPDFNSVST